MNQAMGIIMAQVSKNDNHAHVSVNEEIRRYGDESLHVFLSEFEQIHKHNTSETLCISNMSGEVKKEALHIITMIR